MDDLAKEGGTEALLNKLDELFLEDKDQMTFNVYDTFEKFRRSEDMSMKDYMVRFDVLYEKAKQYGNELTQPVLAYRLLKGANLSEERQALVRATCTKWEYATLKTQLKNLYDEQDSGSSSLASGGAIGGND